MGVISFKLIIISTWCFICLLVSTNIDVNIHLYYLFVIFFTNSNIITNFKRLKCYISFECSWCDIFIFLFDFQVSNLRFLLVLHLLHNCSIYMLLHLIIYLLKLFTVLTTLSLISFMLYLYCNHVVIEKTLSHVSELAFLFYTISCTLLT